MGAKDRVCPACGSRELHGGKVTGDGSYIVAFIPDVASWLSYAPTLHTKAAVCMDCGFVGHFVDNEALEKIRQKQAEQSPKDT